MDLISREEVRQARPEWLNEEVKRETEEATLEARNFSRGWNSCLHEYINNINDLPSVENKGEWIPVSERLPEMGVRVLCACQADLYDVLKLTPDGWLYDSRHTYMFGFVKAWQPLPEPYKAEKGGE